MCVESGVGAWKRVDVGRRAVANGDMLPAAEAWPRAEREREREKCWKKAAAMAVTLNI